MLQIKHANQRIYSHILRALAQWESVRLVLDGPLFPCCEQRALSVISNNTDNECNFCRRAHLQYQTLNEHTYAHTFLLSVPPIHRYRHVFDISHLSDFICLHPPADADFRRCLRRAKQAITAVSTVYMLHRYTCCLLPGMLM